jgi:hypothetical protein
MSPEGRLKVGRKEPWVQVCLSDFFAGEAYTYKGQDGAFGDLNLYPTIPGF